MRINEASSDVKTTIKTLFGLNRAIHGEVYRRHASEVNSFSERSIARVVVPVPLVPNDETHPGAKTGTESARIRIPA